MQKKLEFTYTWTLLWYWKAEHGVVIAINIEEYGKT